MTTIDYNCRKFRSVNNSPNGEVDEETVFEYFQQDEIVWGTYRGGAIRWGTLIAKVDGKGHLDMRYQHINAQGEIMTGKCRSTPELLPDGRLRLHEDWQWTSGDGSAGTSVVEEMRD